MKCVKCGKKAVQSGFCRSHFLSYFEQKVRKTIRRFRLISPKDKMAVAVSGGKDSTVLLYVLRRLGYNVDAITVDAVIGNYTKKNLKNLREVCGKHGIKLHELSFREEFGYSLCYLRDVLKANGHSFSSCMLCGILRRYLLNKYARTLGFDCIATGHTLDDEAQAVLMNIFRNDQTRLLRQGPVSGLKESPHFVRRIKPLYLCAEAETTAYSKIMRFPVQYTRCPCSVNAYRKDFRDFLEGFSRKQPDVCNKIVNFYIDTILPLKEIEKTASCSVGTCELCGEPSSRSVCRKCQLVLAMKDRGKSI